MEDCVGKAVEAMWENGVEKVEKVRKRSFMWESGGLFTFFTQKCTHVLHIFISVFTPVKWRDLHSFHIAYYYYY